MARIYRRRSYQKILAQIEKLQGEADNLRNRERSAAIKQVRTIITRHDLSAAELGFKGNGRGRPAKSTAATKLKVPAKYRGPGGITWSGRGKNPVWLREAMARGKKKEDFLIRR